MTANSSHLPQVPSAPKTPTFPEPIQVSARLLRPLSSLPEPRHQQACWLPAQPSSPPRQGAGTLLANLIYGCSDRFAAEVGRWLRTMQFVRTHAKTLLAATAAIVVPTLLVVAGYRYIPGIAESYALSSWSGWLFAIAAVAATAVAGLLTVLLFRWLIGSILAGLSDLAHLGARLRQGTQHPCTSSIAPNIMSVVSTALPTGAGIDDLVVDRTNGVAGIGVPIGVPIGGDAAYGDDVGWVNAPTRCKPCQIAWDVQDPVNV